MKQNVLKFPFLAMACAIAAVVPLKAADVVSAATNSPAVTNQVLLDDLVNEALEKNPELNFYRAEIDAVHGGRRSAGAWTNPSRASARSLR